MSEVSQQSGGLRGLALLLPLVLAAALAWVYLQPATSATADLPQLAALSQSLPLVAEEAIGGDRAAISQLRNHVSELRNLSARAPGPDSLWQRLLADGDSLIRASEQLIDVGPASQSVNEGLRDLQPGLVELLGANGGANAIDDVDNAALVLSQAITAFAAGEGDPADQAATATSALDGIDQVLRALAGETTGPDIVPIGADGQARGQLEALQATYLRIQSDATAALEAESALRDADQSLRALKRSAGGLLPAIRADAEASSGSDSLLQYVLPGLLGLGLLLALMLMVGYWRAAKAASAAATQSDQNDRNQQAILRLLDELGSLADGDLTVQATVSEDITGAIADSINYAIEALRDLVATINDTAIMVDSAAKQTEAAASNLSRSSQQQSVEVKATTDALGSIISSIEEVSGNAERSSDVARHSVDVAHKGGEAVRRTIDGMNTIRETIQETSKRIKRLGESSQEIGNIVELINDIAEQTNILALNASIQASMAGEAGRGFAVVADEVQRLAERCTNATRQIEVLVRTIQTDTNEAVVSMERSTTDVVGGALLAENAGAALDEIEQVSNQIASLVQNISSSSREQANVAAVIDKRTTNLSKISTKTGQDTRTTAQAIHKLSELASQLRQSVAGFQLPDVGANSGVFETEDELDSSAPKHLKPVAGPAKDAAKAS